MCPHAQKHMINASRRYANVSAIAMCAIACERPASHPPMCICLGMPILIYSRVHEYVCRFYWSPRFDRWARFYFLNLAGSPFTIYRTGIYNNVKILFCKTTFSSFCCHEILFLPSLFSSFFFLLLLLCSARVSFWFVFFFFFTFFVLLPIASVLRWWLPENQKCSPPFLLLLLLLFYSDFNCN